MLDNAWDEPIRAVAGAGAGATVFVESRGDLTAEVASGEGVEIAQSGWSGVTIEREGEPLVYHAGLLPSELAGLAAGAVPGAARSGPDGSIHPNGDPVLDPRMAGGAVTGLVVEAQRRFPQGLFRARWVESDQAVGLGTPAGVVRDRRRTRRIRLDGLLRRGDHTSRACAERVIDAEVPVSALIEETVARLEARLGASAPAPGEATVVFAPAVAGVWIHELVGHAAEADRVERGVSWLAGSVGPFAPELTVIDDPRRARAAWQVDDEGTPTRPIALIHEGRTKEFLHTRATASRMGVEATGHARRGSFRERALARMGCTFIANGHDDPDAILKKVQLGIYVRRMESASTDPARGRAVFRVTDADAIVNGNIDVALQPHLLETQAEQALAAIDGIGNDLAFDTCIGTCHRDGQPLSTSVGAPTICTGLMTVRF